jgi:Sensors of blue-light using FAD
MEKLIHLIYASRAVGAVTPADLLKILEKARRTNASLGVTGMLLNVDASFFQVLEGEEDKVTNLYERIGRDKRHGSVIKLVSEPIDQRDFADWTMAHAKLTKADLSQVEGLNDFFLKGSCLSDLSQGAAQKLLRAFREGKWRAPLA